MVFDQIDPMRLVYIYGLEGALFILFLIMGIKIARRDKQRLNLMLSLFYVFSAIGLLLNFIYVPLSIIEGMELVVLILNYSTIAIIAFSLSFLVLSEIIIYQSTVVFNDKKQIALLLFYVLLNASFFIFFRYDGVIFTEDTDWIAAFSLPFYLYLLAVFSFTGVIPTFYLAIQIRKKFESELLKKRWDFFISGLGLIFLFMYVTYTFNYINRTTFRSQIMDRPGVIAIPQILFVSVGAILIYYGIGTKLRRNS